MYVFEPLRQALYPLSMYDDFIERMYKAFSLAAKPGFEQVTPHRCIECDEIRDQFHPHKNRELPDIVMEYQGDALPLLSAEALRYYLPRYIEYGLLNQDANAFEFTLYHLAPDEINQYWVERIEILSEEEKTMIGEYLQLRRTLEDGRYEEEYILRGLEVWI